MRVGHFIPKLKSGAGLVAASVAAALVLAPNAVAASVCRPVLAFTQIRFSEIKLETMERIWTAKLSVDASPCATTSGRFEILISRLKETAPDSDFVEQFTWKPNAVEVSIDFAADESVQDYRLGRVDACPCRE